ncbi:DUF3800 domain-containing protein [Acidipila sp. EB88]|uniref:DUF3800 domain-containing protein n=1 Tax=Acidipila sp. EB88 TaxID=2305226 RepID=UPI000F5FD9C5|nr:DUF3800 domain-containing protein [Acidipila sp. EB88]RRA50529.1 DUF3800 domain-containing protein [Acidipila sp. EB88]
MHLLYVDESGAIGNPTEKFFILAGVSVFERNTHWIERDLNEIAARFNKEEPYTVELHGSPMRSGKGFWKHQPRDVREQAIIDALSVGIRDRQHRPRLIGAVLQKENHTGKEMSEVAFEQLSSRFDMYLTRLHLKQQDTHRGLMIFDECSTEKRIQTLAREFKHSGHTYGKIRNFAEVPVFLDSRASRLIQLADLVAYAMYRHFEHGDSKYYDVIYPCFDHDGGVAHGLYIR